MLQKICTALTGLVMTCSYLAAQATSGTITGTIHDSLGALIPGVRVVVTDTTKKTSHTTVTNGGGEYNVQFLTPGTYQVSAELAGFKREISQGLAINVDQTQRLDFVMQIGEVSQTVEVTSAPPLVNTETSGIGQVITERPIRDLPLNGRNFAQLVYLVPGVTSGQAGENSSGNSTINPRAASNFNALGSQATANAWVLDGIQDSEYTFDTVMVQASVESVGEFKVLTGTFSSEFGRGAGVVSTSTKSGSNSFHGDIFEFIRNNAVDARNYFNNRPAIQPPFRRNQYGASLGGPIWKQKLFFFMDFYGEQQQQGVTFVDSVPTAQERTGDFSDWKDASGHLIPIYNPFSQTSVNGTLVRTQFPNNVIPANLINPVSSNVVNIYPLPNQPGTATQNNYITSLNNTINDKGGNGRLDYTIGSKDSAFGRYSYEDFQQTAAKGQSGCCIPTPAAAAAKYDLGPYISGGQVTDIRASGLAINEVHIFTPNLVNEITGGYSRLLSNTTSTDSGHASATSLGIMGININADAQSGLPNLNTANYTAINGGPIILPVHDTDSAYQIGDTISWTRGHHALKLGYRLVLNHVSPWQQLNSPANIAFGTNFTSNPATAVGGNGMATFLLGYPTAATRTVLPQPYYMRNQEHSAFAQDDWKVSPRLTANIGLRWDLYTAETEKTNRFTNLDLTNLILIYAGQNGVGSTAGVSTQYRNFGPRVGFAYDLDGKGRTVVRGGFGIVYVPQGVSGSQYLGNALPWTVSQNVNPDTYPTSFANIPQIQNIFPTPATIQPISTADLNAANPQLYAHAFKNLTPSYQSYSLNVQRQIAPATLVEIGYAGSHGVHLEFCYNPNEVQPGPGTSASRRLIQAISNDANLTECAPRNQSNFNSLQLKLSHDFHAGFQSLTSYTYGKSLDYGGSAGNPGMGGDAAVQTVTNFRASYGPSGFDTKQRFVESLVYEIPFGKGRRFLGGNHILSPVVGGWNIDSIVTIQTGNPFTVTLANGVNNGATSWPNRISSGVLPRGTRSAYLWFNPAAFVAPPANTYGNSARGVLYGPGYGNVDASVERTFILYRESNLKVKVDAFNLLNTPNFGLPNSAINPASPAGVVGHITATNHDNRQLQASVKISF